MLIVTVLLAFLAGIACGLALRPGLDRRRRIRSAYAAARARRAGKPVESSDAAPQDAFAMPRDYYLADRKERGSLAEGFGLKAAAGSAVAGTEPDPAQIPLPRDYYERETPEDEGILSEGFGLKSRGEGPA